MMHEWGNTSDVIMSHAVFGTLQAYNRLTPGAGRGSATGSNSQGLITVRAIPVSFGCYAQV